MLMINESNFILTRCSYGSMSAVNGTDYIWETGHCYKLRFFFFLPVRPPYKKKQQKNKTVLLQQYQFHADTKKNDLILAFSNIQLLTQRTVSILGGTDRGSICVWAARSGRCGAEEENLS